VTTFYIYLLGENVLLARAEAEVLVRMKSPITSSTWNKRLGLIDCPANPVEFLLDRAVLVRETGKVLVEAHDAGELQELVNSKLLASLLDNRAGFAVRVLDNDSLLNVEERLEIKRALGAKIRKLSGASVSLKIPDLVLTVAISRNRLLLCESHYSTVYKRMLQIRRRGMPFFHPSMMNAVLARVMCNIGGVMPAHTMLDPFCGGGGILAEAAGLRALVTGIDMSWTLLEGAKSNLEPQEFSNYSLIQADSRHLPISRFERIVTDPPYGQTSSTRGETANSLIERFLEQLCHANQTSISLCICGNSKMKLKNLIEKLGGHVKLQIPIRVHRSLTRELLLAEF
jgi:tRNA (guanine10-N2)-dimethyltransferase